MDAVYVTLTNALTYSVSYSSSHSFSPCVLCVSEHATNWANSTFSHVGVVCIAMCVVSTWLHVKQTNKQTKTLQTVRRSTQTEKGSIWSDIFFSHSKLEFQKAKKIQQNLNPKMLQIYLNEHQDLCKWWYSSKCVFI